jgi:hypothetical protein
MIRKIGVLLVLLFIIFPYIFSQNSSDTLLVDSLKTPTYRRFKASLNYSSANTLLGKKDSVSIPLLSPSFKYTTSKNIFYQISLVHTNTTAKIFDELDAKIGYNYDFNYRWSASIAYTHYFFNKNVDRLNSMVNNDVNLYVAYDWDILYSAISLDYTSGKKTFNTTDTIFGKKGKYALVESTSSLSSKDFTATFMNSRQFFFFELLTKKDRLIISPEIDVYYGTQNSVENNQRTLNAKKLKKTYSQTSNTSNIVPFMAYTFNLDLRYTIDQITFNLSPFYTVPQKIGNESTTKPYFVMYGSIYYSIKWIKK